MRRGDVYPQLMGAPLPQDLAGCHAMIGQLRALLDEHRASFGELDIARLRGAAQALVAGLEMRGHTLPDTLSACRRGARMLVFLADWTLAGVNPEAGCTVRRAAIAGIYSPGMMLRECDNADIFAKVAAVGARKLLDLDPASGGRVQLVTVHGQGYQLSRVAARWVREIVARGAAGLGGDA